MGATRNNKGIYAAEISVQGRAGEETDAEIYGSKGDELPEILQTAPDGTATGGYQVWPEDQG